MTDKIFNEDCIEGMKRIPDGSVDAIICDPPYQITDAPFDKRIPFEPMWEQFKRVTKHNAAIVIFSQMPFGAELIMSNRKMFRYEWIWEKNLGTGFLNAKKMPLKCHENALVFYRKLPTYNPQFTQGKPYHSKHNRIKKSPYGEGIGGSDKKSNGERYPRDVQKFYTSNAGGRIPFHSSEKPVELIEYLIKTYTNENEIVLDATIGSGTTAVACINTNRHFIGFELEEKFYEIAKERIAKAYADKGQRLF